MKKELEQLLKDLEKEVLIVIGSRNSKDKPR